MTKYNTIRHIRFYWLSKWTLNHARVRVGVIHRLRRSELSDTTYNEKWDAEKFTINARLKILTRLMINRVNRRVNAINPAALIVTESLWWELFRNTVYSS